VQSFLPLTGKRSLIRFEEKGGKRWVTSSGEDGIRRLDNPNDFVRTEIVTALYTNIVIGLNNRAQAVGYFDNGVNLVSRGTQRAYLHDRDGTVTDLGSLITRPIISPAALTIAG
jgi:hypothetical protein